MLAQLTQRPELHTAQMVANAGIFLPKATLECTADDWQRTFAVNGLGTFLLIKYAAQQMVKQGRGGRIICQSSWVSCTCILRFDHHCLQVRRRFRVSKVSLVGW